MGDRNKDCVLSVVYQNCNGNPAKQWMIKNKIKEIMETNQLICVFNDIRVQSASEINFDGMASVVSNNPDNNHYAGGCAVVFPKDWSAKSYEITAEEGLIVDLTNQSGEILTIATQYVHPGDYIDDNFIDTIKKIASRGSARILLAGDFNAALKELGSRLDTRQGATLLEKTIDCGLNHIENTQPTFISRINGNWNILDMAFVSDRLLEDLVEFKVGDPMESDHLPLEFQFKSKNKINRNTKSIIDWEEFKLKLDNCEEMMDIKLQINTTRDLHKGNTTSTDNLTEKIDHMVKTFSQLIIQTRTKVTIQKSKTINKNFKIKTDTRELIKQRRRIINTIKINKNSVDVSQLKTEMNRLTLEMRKLLERDKQDDYKWKTEEIGNTKSSAKKWQILNDLMEKKKDNTPLTHLIKLDGQRTTSINDIVDTHATRLRNTHQPLPLTNKDKNWRKRMKTENDKDPFRLKPLKSETIEKDDNLIFDNVNIDFVENQIKRLKIRSAPGDDGIDNATLKNLPPSTLECLVEIFNICLQVGYFPSAWKRASVRMLLKPGRAASDSANYRPVSLLSCVGKLLERIVKAAIDASDRKFSIVPDIHAGFRKGRSTQECFLRLAEAAASAKKRKLVLVAAAIDVDKAFDRLDHDVIRYRLRNSPLPNKVVRIVSSFLEGRTLVVKEAGVKSIVVEMNAGAPQGAILSPTLYILVTRDAPIIIDADESGSQYADDTACWTVAKSVREAVATLQRRLRLLESWCIKWALNPSPTKSELIILSGTKKQRIEAKNSQLFLMGQEVGWKSKIKLLGVTFDENLTWNDHIDILIKSASIKVSAISRLNRKMKFNDKETVLMLFDSLVLSVLLYSGPAYLNMKNGTWDKLECFLVRSIKWIFGLPMNMNSNLARSLFFAETFRRTIELRTLKRLDDIVKKSNLVQDVITDMNDYCCLVGKKTILETAAGISGINLTTGCKFCSFKIPHDCVKFV